MKSGSGVGYLERFQWQVSWSPYQISSCVGAKYYNYLMAKYLRQVPCCLESKLTMGSSLSKLSQLSTCRRACKSRKTETVMKTVPVVMGTRTFRFAGTHTKNRLKIQMMEQKVNTTSFLFSHVCIFSNCIVQENWF